MSSHSSGKPSIDSIHYYYLSIANDYKKFHPNWEAQYVICSSNYGIQLKFIVGCCISDIWVFIAVHSKVGDFITFIRICSLNNFIGNMILWYWTMQPPCRSQPTNYEVQCLIGQTAGAWLSLIIARAYRVSQYRQFYRVPAELCMSHELCSKFVRHKNDIRNSAVSNFIIIQFWANMSSEYYVLWPIINNYILFI